MKILFTLFILFTFFGKIHTQNVGIGTTTPAPSAQLDVSSTTKGFLPPRMDSNARNAIAAPAVGLTIYNTSINAFQCFNGTGWYSTVHYIGEYYGGGIVFYVYDNGQHGLIAATTDLIFPIEWYNDVNKITGSSSDGLGSGNMNTAIITAAQMPDNVVGNFAAKACADHTVTVGGVTYGDWYLPSKYELNLLYMQKSLVGGFADDDYWSSTEEGSDSAWFQYFVNGAQDTNSKDAANSVRPIRSF